MAEIKNLIDNTINDNRVVLFMKGTTEFPQCGYSASVSSLLQEMGIDFKCINVLDDDGIRQGIKEYSNWPTIPQLYIDKEFIGGHDIVMDYHRKNELQKLFSNLDSKIAG